MRSLLNQVEDAFGAEGRKALLECFQGAFHAGEPVAIGATVEYAEALLRLAEALGATSQPCEPSSSPAESASLAPHREASGDARCVR